MTASDRHNGQRDERTNEQTDGRTDAVRRPSLRWSLTLTGWEVGPRKASARG